VDAQFFLRSRRSIRRFSEQAVEIELLRRIIETSTYAPSAHDRQPWRYAVIVTQRMKKELADGMAAEFERDLAGDGLPKPEIRRRVQRSRSRIEQAPVVIIICLDDSDLDQYGDDRRQEAESIMGIQSVSMAGLQLLQAASAEGLGGVWTCGPLFAPDSVRSVLHLPGAWKPQGMILLGYPGEIPQVKEIKPIEEVVKFID
jgi:coenzyme F420-0:L-glutamate ligase / coenzyme F420-1:gamma-L-glutamate ligase